VRNIVAACKSFLCSFLEQKKYKKMNARGMELLKIACEK